MQTYTNVAAYIQNKTASESEWRQAAWRKNKEWRIRNKEESLKNETG